MEAGSVQGVVVQIMVETFLPASAGSIFASELAVVWVEVFVSSSVGFIFFGWRVS
jgi:hypothetical protein